MDVEHVHMHGYGNGTRKTAMKFYRVEQGSGDWFKLRMGKPTSSMFHKIVTPGGKLSEQRKGYMYKLIAERLLLESMDQSINVEWVERGRELEPAAVQNFQFQNDVELEPGGFVTDDLGRAGCSPDRLVKGVNEAVEIKCPAAFTQIGYLLDGLGTDHKPQVQGQLAVGQFDRVHFYSYHPRMPAVHLVTLPDPAYLKILVRLVSDFVEELDYYTERARALGAYVANPGFTTPLDETVPPPDPLQIIVP
jgi:hypothetical protein